jgi:hypothetical protein
VLTLGARLFRGSVEGDVVREFVLSCVGWRPKLLRFPFAFCLFP